MDSKRYRGISPGALVPEPCEEGERYAGDDSESPGGSESPSPAGVVAIGGGFEAVSLKVLPWVERREDKLKSQGVPVEAVSEFGVRLTLPLWAQPGRPKTSVAPKKIGEGQSLMDDLPVRK